MTGHGTPNRYRNGGCDCDACKAAWAAYGRQRRATRRQAIPPHCQGTANFYNNYLCRCATCCAANTARARQYRQPSTANR